MTVGGTPDQLDSALIYAEQPDYDPEFERVKAVLESRLLGRPPGSNRIGRFVVLERLGAGAMGVVYSAFDPRLDRKVAIKLLFDGERNGQERARLLGEAKALAQLAHPNVVAVYEVGEHHGRVFLAMEYVQGRTLKRWLAEAPRTWRETLAICVQAGRGLAAAHAAGIVHRDFKPDNVLVGDAPRGAVATARARVLDFGLARQTIDETIERRTESSNALGRDHRAPDSNDGAIPTRLTRTGTLLGTPAYMSPEQLHGEPADARSDQFAFCVTLWESLFEQRPFAGKTVVELAAEVGRGEIASPVSGHGVPRWLHAVVRKGLARSPTDRHASIDELLGLLERGPRRIPVRAIAAVSVLFAGAAATFGSGAQPPPCEVGASIIGDLWNDDRRGAVTGSFLATGLPYAADAGSRVGAQLDAFAADWARTHDEVCSSTLVRAEQSDAFLDARMACLRRQRAVLQGFVDALANADAMAVENAVAAVEQMPAPSACERIEQRDPSASDARNRSELEVIHARLAEASVQHRLGHLDAAWRLATDTLTEARDASRDSLLSEVLLEIGGIADERGAYDEAEGLLREAAALALAAGRDDIAAAAAIEILLVVGERQERVALLEDLVRTAEAALQRAGDPPDLRIRFHEFVGAALRARSRHADSLRHLELARAAAETRHGDRSQTVAMILSSTALTHLLAGDPLLALGASNRAEEILASTLPDHPNRAANLTNRAGAFLSLGRFDEAFADQRTALSLKTNIHGPGHARLRTSLAGLAQGLYQQGRTAEALVYAAWGLAILSAHPEVASDRDSAGTLVAWGLVFYDLGLLDEAESAFERAAIVLRELSNPQLAVVLLNLGNIAERGGDLAKAEQWADEAIALSEATLSPTAPQLGNTLKFRGSLLIEIGRHTDAERDLERALAIAEHNGDTTAICSALAFLSRLELSRDRADAAAAYLERAVAVAADESADLRGELRFRRARALAAMGDAAQARSEGRAAAKAFDEADAADDSAAVRAWLAGGGPNARSSAHH